MKRAHYLDAASSPIDHFYTTGTYRIGAQVGANSGGAASARPDALGTGSSPTTITVANGDQTLTATSMS